MVRSGYSYGYNQKLKIEIFGEFMAKSNSNITFNGSKLTVMGKPLKEGDKAPDFTLTNSEMKDVTLGTFAGKPLIVSVVPSLDTSTCHAQTKRFDSELSEFGDSLTLLTVSLDLPFAQKRWCASEKSDRVIALSDYKHRSFGQDWGVYIKEMGLLARAVFVLDKDHIIRHVEYTDNISNEPDYGSALSAARSVAC